MQFDHVRLEKSWATLFQVTGKPTYNPFFYFKVDLFLCPSMYAPF